VFFKNATYNEMEKIKNSQHMSYKSYSEQIDEHIMYLQSRGFDIGELKVNADFVRCHQKDKCQYRGELAYKTRTTKLNNGLTGVQTWFRGPKGESSSFRTYGLGPTETEEIKAVEKTVELKQIADTAKYDAAARKAYGFWQYSAVKGRADYLERKRVGSYGIRFRSTAQYGNSAVIPMVDTLGRLWSYQLLNPNGTKRQPKDARTEGLFHMIGTPRNGQSIGIGESYVTSASCYELAGVPTACAFSCQNLKNIAVTLSQHYPKSRLIIFADNDRHLEERGAVNQGLVKGQEAINAIESGAVLITPDFGDSCASKGLSDWNDLIHQSGIEYAKAQMKEQLNRKGIVQLNAPKNVDGM
jgi:phage/plasmid primase-like uncharacterized protein